MIAQVAYAPVAPPRALNAELCGQGIDGIRVKDDSAPVIVAVAQRVALRVSCEVELAHGVRTGITARARSDEKEVGAVSRHWSGG